jgi:glycine cleavage system aminomethyltransferase T
VYAGSLAHLHGVGTEYRDVAGTRLAWKFSDYQTEYKAIRNSAALFDHTAVGLTRLTGDVTRLLQRVLARDVEFLTPERSMMTLMFTDDGRPIDLMTVYSFDDYVILESSYGRQHDTRQHLAAQAGDQVEITALDGEWGMLGIEGPYSWGALGRVLDPSLTALPYESVLELEYAGAPIIFSRSGFTGEYGYKIIGPSGVIADLWERLGNEATPVGQQALETAMLEVRQPILHREVSADTDVVSCGIQWLTDPTKDEFIGRGRLMAQLTDTASPRMLGITWAGDACPAGTDVVAGETVIGKLKVSVDSPSLSRWLGLAVVDRDLAAPGLTLDLRNGRHATDAVSLSSPYVVPTSWSTPIL